MDVFIADALRTPRGRGNSRGGLQALTPIALLAQVARALPEGARLAAEDAFIGCVTQTGEQGGNLARLALLEGDVPETCAAMTVNRFCASSLSATVLAALRAQHADGVVLAGGVETMSRVPLGADHGAITDDAALLARQGIVSIAAAADAIASRHHVTREEADAYALRSQRRAVEALAAGVFRSVVPSLLAVDECPRPSTSLASLAALPTLRGGVHTVGTAPASADGAALLVVGTAQALSRSGLRPRARLAAFAEVGGDRRTGLDGVVEVSRRVLSLAGVGVGEVDVFEVNEAFAAVMVHYTRALELDEARLNPNGGAIALGHPMGATGAMLVGMALDELERRGGHRALVAICGAAGLATALLLER